MHTHTQSLATLPLHQKACGVVAYLLWDPSGYFFGEEQS